MSKAHFPHWRYIAFRVRGDRAVSRRAMQNAVTGRSRKEGVADDDLPRLTRYAWPHGIVRVHHHRLAAARDWLPRITWAVQEGQKVPLRLDTLSASGTIKSLTDRLGILRERGPTDGGGSGPRSQGRGGKADAARTTAGRGRAGSRKKGGDGGNARTGKTSTDGAKAGPRSRMPQGSGPVAAPGARRRP